MYCKGSHIFFLLLHRSSSEGTLGGVGPVGCYQLGTGGTLLLCEGNRRAEKEGREGGREEGRGEEGTCKEGRVREREREGEREGGSEKSTTLVTVR